MDKDKILSKSKIGLMTKGSVFLCTIAFSLRYQWSEDLPTAGVNGVDMLINPTWFCNLQPDERVGLLAHEAWHVALNHVGETGRQKDRCPEIFNYAGDYVINLLITDANMVIPPDGLLDSKYRNWTTLAVYDDLIKGGKKKPSSSWSGDVLPSPLSPQEQQAQVTQLLVKASIQSKMAKESPGNIPKEISRTIDAILNPVLPWNTLLSRFLTDMSADDFTWRKPNKRFMPQVILPTQHSESLGHLVIAIDTSGSVSKRQLTEILSEITHIKSQFNPKRLTILDCDTKINHIHDVTENDDISDLTFSGGGGTRCAPPIEYAKEHNAQALLYFTDGEFSNYNGKIDFPLLWIIYDNPKYKSNIGEVVIYNGSKR